MKIALGIGSGAIAGFAVAMLIKHRIKNKKLAVVSGITTGGIVSAGAVALVLAEEKRKQVLPLGYNGSLYPKLNLLSDGGKSNIKPVKPNGLKTAIAILKSSKRLSFKTKSVMNEQIVRNLYRAESKRMHPLEKIGIDGETIGRGQVSRKGYKDVVDNFQEEIEIYSEKMNAKFSRDFRKDMRNRDIEDFVVTFFLALNIEKRQKNGRSAEDAAKFGIGFYHGARETIVNAQFTNQNDMLSFDGTEKALRKGTKNQQDILNYIEEVLYGEN